MPRRSKFEELMRRTERWREQYNPLRGLTIQRAVCLLEAYRRGEMADLQWLYSHIEETDPTLLALVERRTSALTELDWDIRVIEDEDLPAIARSRGSSRLGSPEKLAELQRDFLRAAYDQIDNLREGVDFLAMSTFRGFAHLQKHRDSDGQVNHLEPLDQWNWVRKGMYGPWFYNPKAQIVTAEALEHQADARIEPTDFIIRTVPRHIDRIALIKFVRQSLAEKDWTAFVEIYGIPGGVVMMPPNVPEGKTEEYQSLCSDVAAGGNGVIPNGGDYKPNDGPRGVNPFRDFLRYLDEKLVLAGTGGLLTMLTESGSGTLAGSAHQKTFEAIARADGKRVSEVFQRQLDAELIHQEFGEHAPVLAYFELSRSELDQEEIKFKRDVFLQFMRDGTVSDVMANLTNLRELTAECGVPAQPDYEEPWLPVKADGGGLVTGETVKDKEGDIVGGAEESNTETTENAEGTELLAVGANGKPPEGGDQTKANGAMKNRRSDGQSVQAQAMAGKVRKAFAVATKEAFRPVATTLQRLSAAKDEGEFRRIAEVLIEEASTGSAVRRAAVEKQAGILDSAMGAALVNGLGTRRAGHQSTTKK